MKTILTALFTLFTLSVLAAPPPPFFRNNYDTQACTYVFIDCRGLITANNNTSIVVNSQWNTIDNANIAATVSGGMGNIIHDPGSDEATISGGVNNVIDFGNSASTITAGSGNNIDNTCPFSFIGAGVANRIFPGASEATICGGEGNTISKSGAGQSFGFIGAGQLNSISDGPNNVIVGGTGHTIVGGSSQFIGGGTGNGIDSTGGANTISGGQNNTINIQQPIGFATIGGGRDNISASNYCTVAGGFENKILGLASSIGGGGHNTIEYFADHGTIGGGSLNSLTNGAYMTIGGGSTNSITNGFASTISGGYDNHMDSQYSTISGGLSNKIWGASSTYGFIGGGHFNTCQNFDSVIAGGFGNFITASANGDSTISGGQYNLTVGDFTSIIGGRQNTNASGDYSTILGGYSNRTEGAAAVVGGRAGCSIGDGTWFFKDNSSGRRSNNVPNTLEAYFTGAGADGASIKLGVQDILATGTNRNYKGTRSDGVVTPLIGLLSDTNRIRSSGANFGVIFNNSSDSFLTRMDNNGNWGFGTNVPQAKIHILGTGTNVAVLRFANCDTNKPATPDTKVRYLAVILDDGIKYFIPLEK